MFRSSTCVKNVENVSDDVLKFVGRVFNGWPFLTLFATLIIAGLLSFFAFYNNGVPEFDDPYLGFETRFTRIGNRMVTLSNFRRELGQLDKIENYPGEKASGRETRKRRNDYGYCNSFPIEEYARVALELSSPSDIFTQETLSLICFFQKLMEDIPDYGFLCEYSENKACCPMWSLPNYIAAFFGKNDCSKIKVFEIKAFKEELLKCQPMYLNKTSLENCQMKNEKCPNECHSGGVIHTTLDTTIDNSFKTSNASKYTMVIIPIGKSQILRTTEELQESISNLNNLLPNNSTVKLAGFDFGGKDTLFKKYLISDLIYVFFASLIIFAIVSSYTKSVFVTVISFIVLTLSMTVGYFLYKDVFGIPYFPFMNMLVTIIVLGIGTDGTLIFCSVWARLRKEIPERDRESRNEIVFLTLKETTATLFITTCTTAGAFFASLTTSVTTIKCFSVFAGTTIIVSFILLYITVPTALVASEKSLTYFKYMMLSHSTPKKKSKILAKLSKLIARGIQKCRLNDLRRNLQNVLERLTKVGSKTWTLFLFITTVLLFWSMYVVFISPGFSFPTSEQFQLLKSSHPVEIYDRDIEPAFRRQTKEENEGDKMVLYFMWGLMSSDTGSPFDPTDDGKLEFDPLFRMDSQENQQWMKKMCKAIQKQSFYDEEANSVVGSNYDACFLSTMEIWMERRCEHGILNGSYAPCCKETFPYAPNVYSTCVGRLARDVYRTPSFYFQPDIAGPKFFLASNMSEMSEMGNLATFTLRAKTNISYSLSFEKMNNFFLSVNEFFEAEMKDAPEGLKNGFFVSAHLDFYDLQQSLMWNTWSSVSLSAFICFILLWISTWKFSVATGAAFSIIATVIVSSAILIKAFNWKLGVFESIAVTVAVGLSDFTAHHSIEYSKRKSVAGMAGPTMFAALTTLTMGFMIMNLSNVLVYEEIGSFFFVLILVSWLYAVFFLAPILALLQKLAEKGFTICCSKRRSDHAAPEDTSSLVEDASRIYINPSVAEAFEEPSDANKKEPILVEKLKLLKRSAKETTV